LVILSCLTTILQLVSLMSHHTVCWQGMLCSMTGSCSWSLGMAHTTMSMVVGFMIGWKPGGLACNDTLNGIEVRRPTAHPG
jgi:hypothetical protein